MPDGACLAGFASAAHVDHDVERRIVIGDLQWLPHDHATGFAIKELVDRLFVDDELARALLDEYPRDGAFAASCSVVIVADHGSALEVERFRLLRRVRMRGTGVA